jgi:hypothetical protein
MEDAIGVEKRQRSSNIMADVDLDIVGERL